MIAKNYPEVQTYLTELCQKSYHESLAEDELFYIHSEFKNGEVSLLFSSKALLKNLIKPSNVQSMFVHIDCTFKLVDLGLPLMIISTETLNHSFRPVAFCLTWAESIDYVMLLLSKLSYFYKEKFNFSFCPLFVMSDNADAFITGCKSSFAHEFIHLSCHFHITKRLKDKTQGGELKQHKVQIFFGVKCLKNPATLPIFKNTWTLVSKYWKENNLPEKFINTFESEYIKKTPQWHYGASFPGKSRTNNSLESGNNVLKTFFNRKAVNIREFLGKMRKFIEE